MRVDATRAAAVLCSGVLFIARVSAQERTPLESAIGTHWLVVQTERAERFLSACAAAAPEARERALKTLERMRSPGAGLLSPPSLTAIASAQRALEGRSASPEEERLTRIVEALDLQPAPGVFEARSEGLGTAVTVSVCPLYALTDRVDVDLSLLWISPQGEVQSARRERVEAAALQPPGFPMYVRAPLAEPGTWHLVAECDRDGVRARGIPVAFECVERLGERLRQMLAHTAPPDSPRALLAVALTLREQRGLRTLAGILPSEMLRQIEAESGPGEGEIAPAGPSIDAVAPLQISFTDAQGMAHWTWSFRPAGELERAVILLAPSTEAPEAALAREEWRRFAREKHAWILSTHLPSDAKQGTTVSTLLGRLRRLANRSSTLVAARGGSVGPLVLGLSEETELPFDALVLSTLVSSPAPEQVLPLVPRFLIAPGGLSDLPASIPAGSSFVWLDGASVPLVNELRLPEWIERMLALLAEATPPSPPTKH